MKQSFVIYGNPLGKPRQTRSDQWKQRPCVMKYRAWCDLARTVAFQNPLKKLTLAKPAIVWVRAYMDSGKQHRVGPHTVKPDGDNILKGVIDALFANDQMIYDMKIQKLWCDGGKPRVEVEWFY